MPRDRHKPRAQRAAHLADALAALLGDLAESRESSLDRVRLAWPGVCGPALTRVTEPLRFDGRLLVVGVRGAVWRDAVFGERDALYRALRRVVPGLGGVRLVTLPEAPPGSITPPPIEAPPPPDPRNADVLDAELRAALDALSAVRRRPEEET